MPGWVAGIGAGAALVAAVSAAAASAGRTRPEKKKPACAGFSLPYLVPRRGTREFSIGAPYTGVVGLNLGRRSRSKRRMSARRHREPVRGGRAPANSQLRIVRVVTL